MFAEFGTADLSILVVIVIAIIGFLRDSIKTKFRFNKEYTELSTSVNMELTRLKKDMVGITNDLKVHTEDDRKERKAIYEKMEALHEKIADDNENINQTIHETEKNILAQITKLELSHVKCKNYAIK